MHMRRFYALITALLLLLLYLPATAEPPPDLTPLPGYTLKPSDEEILVYTARNLKAGLAGTIKPGAEQTVQVLSLQGDWCYVRFTTANGERYGYLPLSCFEALSQPTATPTPENVLLTGTAAWVLNHAEGYRLNLRETPSHSSVSLGRYYTGTPVTLTGIAENGFVQLLLAGSTLGWMDERYLTLDASNLVPETPQLAVLNNGATLRSGPDSTYDRLGWFARGTIVTVLGVRTDGWYHVQADDLVGYMASSVLSGDLPTAYGMDSDNPALTGNTDQVSVFYINTRSSGSMLHLRKAPSTSAKSLGQFYTGTPLSILSYTRTGWAYVRIGQTEGYMDADYLTTTQPTRYGILRSLHNSRATGLNMRRAPSTGGELLSFVPNNAVITLLGTLSDGWCYVDYNGLLGYMLADGYLKAP